MIFLDALIVLSVYLYIVYAFCAAWRRHEDDKWAQAKVDAKAAQDEREAVSEQERGIYERALELSKEDAGIGVPFPRLMHEARKEVVEDLWDTNEKEHC